MQPRTSGGYEASHGRMVGLCALCAPVHDDGGTRCCQRCKHEKVNGTSSPLRQQ
jgi:hypothetical protein